MTRQLCQRGDNERQHLSHKRVVSSYEEQRRGLDLGVASYFKKAEGREVLESVFYRMHRTAV